MTPHRHPILPPLWPEFLRKSSSSEERFNDKTCMFLCSAGGGNLCSRGTTGTIGNMCSEVELVPVYGDGGSRGATGTIPNADGGCGA